MKTVYKIKDRGTFDPSYPEDTKLNPSFIADPMYNYCGQVYLPTTLILEDERVKLNDWWWHLSWVIKGTLDADGNFIPAPDEEQFHPPRILSSRSEWNTSYDKNLMISNKVINLIEKVVEKQISTTGHFHRNYRRVRTESDYGFTWIDISQTDKKKLSGIAFNTLEAFTWENSYHREPTLNTNLECNLLRDEPEYNFRQRKGTFLKPAKLLRVLLPDLSDHEITNYAAKLARTLRELASPNTSIVKVSTTPSEIYTMTSYFDSCMKNQDPTYFQIYDDLEHTSIAYIEEDGVLRARALIHDQVYDGDSTSHSSDSLAETIRIIDRVYAEDEDYEVIMLEWAREKGYLRKSNQSGGCWHYLKPDGTKVYFPNLYIKCHDLVSVGYQQVPYIDTFYKYNHAEGVLGSGLTSYDTVFNGTDGIDSNEFVVSDDRVTCDRCDCTVESEDDLYIVHRMDLEEMCVCRDCRDYAFIQCEECGEYHRPSNIVRDSVLCNCCAERLQVEAEPEPAVEIPRVAAFGRGSWMIADDIGIPMRPTIVAAGGAGARSFNTEQWLAMAERITLTTTTFTREFTINPDEPVETERRNEI